MTFRRGLAVTAAIQGAALLLSAIFILLASRWLGPEGKGLQAILVSAGQLFGLVLSFGLAASMPYIVSSDIRRAALVALRQAQLLVAAAAVLCAAAILNRGVTLAPPLVGFEAVLIAFTLLAIAQSSYSSLALSAGRLSAFNVSALIGAAVSLVVLGSLFVFDIVTAEWVVWAQALGMAVAVGYVLVDLRLRGLLRISRLVTVDTRSHVRAAALGYVTALLTFVMLRVDIFLVAALAGGLSAVGIYSVAIAIAELLLRLPHWSGFLLMPIVAKQGLDARIQTVKLFWVSMGFALSLFLVAIVLGTWLNAVVVSVLGAEFSPVLVVLYTMFPRIVFQSGGTILASNLGAWGYTMYSPGSIGVGLIAVVALDLLLIPRYGLLGAGLSSSAAAFAALVVTMIGFLRLNGLGARALLLGITRWNPRLADAPVARPHGGNR
jgi:O-antigen/teichoic acid export membrane protein